MCGSGAALRIVVLTVFVLTGATKEALKSGLSDMEYLRSKVAQPGGNVEQGEEEEDEEEEDDDEDDAGPVPTDSAYESGDRDVLKAKASAPASTPASAPGPDKNLNKASSKSAKQEVRLSLSSNLPTST